jgi:hypothetical protein
MLLHLKLVSQRLFVLSPQDGRVKISSLPCGYASLARDHLHTYEPIASRRRAEPHRRPWRAQLDSAEPDSWRPTHRRVWLSGTGAEPDSRVRLVRVWAPLDRVATVIGGDSLYPNNLEPKLLILITNIKFILHSSATLRDAKY